MPKNSEQTQRTPIEENDDVSEDATQSAVYERATISFARVAEIVRLNSVSPSLRGHAPPNKSVNRTLDSRLLSLPLQSAPVKRRLPRR